MGLIRNAGSTMRRFVLGDLTEQSRLELEERLIPDPAAFDTLGVVEEELADAYVDGELTAAETEGFERHYLVDRDHRRHIALIKLLKSRAAVARPRPVSPGR